MHDPPHVIHAAEAGATGTLAVIESIVRAHKEAGFRSTVLLGRRPESPDEFASRFPVGDLVEVCEIDDWRSRKPVSQFRAAMELRRRIKRLGPSIVVLHSSFAGFAGLLVPRSVQTAYVPHAFASQVTSSRVKRFVLTIAETIICRNVRTVVAVSESESKVAKRRLARRVTVIRNGIPQLNSPPHFETNDRDNTVVAVGHLVPQKCPEKVLEVMSMLPAKRIWIGDGDGQYGGGMRKKLEASGIQVTGWLEPEQALKILQSAKVYIHWTSWDGLSIALLEAMACGAVVVASDIEPNREAVGQEFVYSSTELASKEVARLLDDDRLLGDARRLQADRASQFGEDAMRREWNEFVVGNYENKGLSR